MNAREYLFERLLPLWRDAGWDPTHGGFHERLERDRRPVDLGYKRLLVQCRQLFTFSHAVGLGVDDGFSDLAHRAFQYIREHYRSPDGGWIFTVAPTGEPLDRTRDAYAHAFLLFAFAHYDRTFAIRDARDESARTQDFLDDVMAHPRGGYVEGLDGDGRPTGGPRRQNPHMHLLEGFLAQAETTRDPRWPAAADAMVELFERHFFDRESDTLGEYFTEDWDLDPERGHVVEAGHHFEWTWLLHEVARLRGRPDVPVLAKRLFEWAVEHGFGPDGGILDEVDRSGTPLRQTRRIWPHTEYLKACIVRHEADPEPGSRARIDAAAQLLFDRYLRDDGTWNEHLDDTGACIQTTLPGTTSYHIGLALAEWLRLDS